MHPINLRARDYGDARAEAQRVMSGKGIRKAVFIETSYQDLELENGRACATGRGSKSYQLIRSDQG